MTSLITRGKPIWRALARPVSIAGGEPADLVRDLLPGHPPFLPFFVKRGVQCRDIPAKAPVRRGLRRRRSRRRGVILHEALRRPVEPQQHLQDDVSLAAASVARSGHTGDADRVQHWPRVCPVDFACRTRPGQPARLALLVERRVERSHVEVFQPGGSHAHYLRRGQTLVDALLELDHRRPDFADTLPSEGARHGSRIPQGWRTLRRLLCLRGLNVPAVSHRHLINNFMGTYYCK